MRFECIITVIIYVVFTSIWLQMVNIRKTFRHTWSTSVFPLTQVIASTSASGLAKANIIACASSIPASQSMISCVLSILEKSEKLKSYFINIFKRYNSYNSYKKSQNILLYEHECFNGIVYLYFWDTSIARHNF